MNLGTYVVCAYKYYENIVYIFDRNLTSFRDQLFCMDFTVKVSFAKTNIYKVASEFLVDLQFHEIFSNNISGNFVK